MRIFIDAGPSRRGFTRLSTFLRCPQLFAYRYPSFLLRSDAGTQAELLDRYVLDSGEGGTAEYEALAASSGSRAPLLKGGLIHCAIAHLYAQLGASQGGVVVAGDCLPEGMTVAPHGGVMDVLGNRVPGIERFGRSDLLVTAPGHFYAPEEAIDRWCQLHPEGEGYRALAENVVREYARHYRDDGETLRILAVEREHSLGEDALGRMDWPDVEGHPDFGAALGYTARIDYEVCSWDGTTGAIFERGPSVFFGDHKTSGWITGKAAEYYSTHGQFTGYRVMGAREWGGRFAGVILNMIETTGNRFERPPLELSPGLTAGFLGRVRRAEHDIARLELATMRGELSPWEWPAAMQELVCYHRYGRCENWAKCQWGSP